MLFKIDTPTGTRTIGSNNWGMDRKNLTPVQFKTLYTKDGWLTEHALRMGRREGFRLNGENYVTMLWDGVKFHVEGEACAVPYRETFSDVRRAREYMRHVANKMYPEY